jgi:NIMA (never in mitosis gene a)-related kinase
VRILASVHHQAVIKYYDAFIESDKLYIVTELAKGGDIGAKVKRHLSRKELMNEDMIWGFFIQICQGLRNIHAANLHRDIKAANIFLVTAREVKIGDLGVAKITKGGMAHTQIGTPYYMSPEIWRNRPYNKKSDIWSLGCLLYELASLKHPFEARDEKGLAEKVLRGTYAPIPSQYSADLATMIKMMLVVDPAFGSPSADYSRAKAAESSAKQAACL